MSKAKRGPIHIAPTLDRPVRLYFQRSTGHLRATWYEPGINNPQSTTLGLHTPDNFRAAVEWCENLADSITELQLVDSPDKVLAPTYMLVEAFLDPANHHGRWRQRTASKMAEIARNLLTPDFLNRQCQAQTARDFQHVLEAAWQDGKSKSRLEDLKRFLTNLANFARREEWFLPSQDVLGKLVVPLSIHDVEEPGGVDRLDIPTDAHIDALLEALKPNRMAFALTRLALSTGARWSELVALTPADFDFTRGIVSISKKLAEDTNGEMWIEATKNRKSRLVPMHAADKELMESLCDEATKRYEEGGLEQVFVSPQGRLIRRSNFGRRIFIPAKKQAGWDDPRWTFHTLRHWVAIHYLEDKQFPLTQVAKVLGHSDATVTARIYAEGRADTAENFAIGNGWERAPQTK